MHATDMPIIDVLLENIKDEATDRKDAYFSLAPTLTITNYMRLWLGWWQKALPPLKNPKVPILTSKFSV
jgi:hypothetical protein